MNAIVNQAASEITIAAVTTVPRETAAGEFKLELSRRSSEKNPIPEALRYRAAFIPEGQLKISSEGIPSKFAVILQATIHDLAQTVFARAMKESEFTAKEIQVASYTVDSVLAAWAIKKESERINAEQITNWLESSETLKQESFAAGSKKRAVWLARVPKIAAPAFKNSFTNEEAATILATIIETDLESVVGEFVANRLNIIISQVSQENAF